MKIKKLLIFTIFLCLMFVLNVDTTQAMEISKLGVHILNVSELNDAKKLVTPYSDRVLGANIDELQKITENQAPTDQDYVPFYQNWSYVTVPLTLDDLNSNKEVEWQSFFDYARELKVIPIVRLTTEYSPEINAWIVPNKKQIINQINFLSKLNWPTEEKHIIVYNEVNHASEWGGRVDPEEYSEVLKFVSNWAHTEEKNFVVLPAAMDLAAPNGQNTLEAFNYLSQMHNLDPEIFSYIDIWNSHSYPNPGFASAPTRYGQNSLRGFENELAFLKLRTNIDFNVMITETGWKETAWNSKKLSEYYVYAMKYIWSDDRVLAVTPFILKGAPGPFSSFSFYDENNQPTNQFYAFESALEKVFGGDVAEISLVN